MLPFGVPIGIALILATICLAWVLGSTAARNSKAWRQSQLTDDAELARFGYAQQLVREMGGFSNFALSFSVISVLTGGITLYGYGLTNGGPVVMGIGWPLVTFFVLIVAASMAELASAMPTAGALYHWSCVLGGAGWGWFTAVANLVGLVATIAGIDYGCAQFLVPLIGLPETPLVTLAVCGALLAIQALINHRGIRLTAKLNGLSAWYHIAGVAAIVLGLAFFATKQPVTILFTKTYTTLKDHPYTYAFMIALLQAQWTFTGYDASAHISEETHDAQLKAPWGVFNSVVVSAVAGFLMLAFVTISIGDLDKVAAATNPFIAVMEGALGGVAGKAGLWLVMIAMAFCGLACITSTSRMIFAFSRDGGLPLAKHLSAVDRRGTPAVAVWVAAILSWILPALITLIVSFNTKSETNPNGLDFNSLYPAVTGIGVIGLYLSYGAPILLKLRAKSTGFWDKVGDGPWSLGKLGKPVEIIALIWIVVITVLFVLPPNSMSGWIFGGVTTVSIAWWLIKVRRVFKGADVSHLTDNLT